MTDRRRCLESFLMSLPAPDSLTFSKVSCCRPASRSKRAFRLASSSAASFSFRCSMSCLNCMSPMAIGLSRLTVGFALSPAPAAALEPVPFRFRFVAALEVSVFASLPRAPGESDAARWASFRPAPAEAADAEPPAASMVFPGGLGEAAPRPALDAVAGEPFGALAPAALSGLPAAPEVAAGDPAGADGSVVPRSSRPAFPERRSAMTLAAFWHST
mmetsp:Transcript_7849/g.19982  ORF Transcript_7849/g.19982 Transcript_7849/m.19982 type:complete len:216 (+) Transcript_7849:628-1275(+)